jgi:hypothetical protein
MRDIATSSRNDEVTQLARDHADTLSKMSQYSQDKAYNEHMAKSYQESYNRASSLTVSERSNLRDLALEIAKERGYTKSEASQMIDSSSTADKEQAQSWLMETKSRETVRMKPTMPQMKQPDWGDYNQKQAESDFRHEYKQQEQQTQANINKIDNDRKVQKKTLQSNQSQIKNIVNDVLRNTESNISQEKMEIKNKTLEIRQKEKERAVKGAIVAVKDKTINTFLGSDD